MAKKTLYCLILAALLVACIEEPREPDNRQFIVSVDQNVANRLDFQMVVAQASGGGTVNLADYLGRVILIQFTTWDCDMSYAKMKYIEREIWEEHKNNPNFKLLGIARRGENTPERVDDLIKRTGVTYPIAIDPMQEFFMRFAERDGGATRDILIDSDGYIVKLTRFFNREAGNPEFFEMVDLIDKLLAAKNESE